MRPETSQLQVRHESARLLVTTSWDDGHPADLRVADLLAKHGLQGTFYVPTRNSEGRPVMSSPQIIELGRQFEIGGHTCDHVRLTEMELPLAARQISNNKRWLEDRLGREVKGFAYVRGQHNAAVRDLVRQAGFHYARTIKNLMTTPGADPLQVPTTTQFYGHSFATYLRNYLSGGPSAERTGVLVNVVAGHGLSAQCLRAAEFCARHGGYFHLWGHSWELDEYDLWKELDCLLGHLRQLEARFVTNAAWCANLTAAAETSAHTASETAGLWSDRISPHANGSTEVS